MSLTDAKIKRLKPPSKGQKTYYDDALRGFGVRVSQGGTKTFVVLYGPQRRRKSLGRYPDMSLAEARARAKSLQAEFALESPREHVRPKLKFDDARRLFLADSERRNKPRTVEEYRRLLHKHFAFDLPLSEINRHKLVQILDRLKSTPAEQKHAFVAIRTMMNWCWKRGYIDASPVPPLTFPSAERNRILRDDELRSVWHRAGGYGYPFGAIVQLLILTGQRRNEITNLRRSWIAGDTITFPSEYVKNNREHSIPLGPKGISLVESLPETSDLLFPSRLDDAKPFNGFSRAKRNFDKEIDVQPYTLHDLRRTFSSLMARIGTPIHVTERILNHASGTISGVAAVYNRHSYQEEMRTALHAYEAHLSKMLES
ncbi:integrase [Roseovarius sp. A46]|uniref:tyrosine-type recombinase/integrase n=1 Tax=Roseovarius sp. A46 TaxID=2109331 RepID=UPI0010100A67|nr:site-specific integrase [Roseovarius sp. A46]RXV64712.1 integrase [Roseovarius sp. A46]